MCTGLTSISPTLPSYSRKAIGQCEMDIGNENDQADRIISTGKLHALRHFHTQPINVVVFNGSDREN